MFFHPLQASLHVELEKAGKLLNIEMKKSFFLVFFPGGNSENEHLPRRTGAVRVVRFHHCPKVQLSARTSSKRPFESAQVKK